MAIMEKCLKIIIKCGAKLESFVSTVNEKIIAMGKLEGSIQKTNPEEVALTVAGLKTDVDQIVDFCYQLQVKMKIEVIEIIPQIYDQKLFRGRFRVI